MSRQGVRVMQARQSRTVDSEMRKGEWGVMTACGKRSATMSAAIERHDSHIPANASTPVKRPSRPHHRVPLSDHQYVRLLPTIPCGHQLSPSNQMIQAPPTPKRKSPPKLPDSHGLQRAPTTRTKNSLHAARRIEALDL